MESDDRPSSPPKKGGLLKWGTIAAVAWGLVDMQRRSGSVLAEVLPQILFWTAMVYIFGGEL